MEDSSPGSSVHGIFQARILEWISISYSKGSSQLRDPSHVSCISCIAGRFFTIWAMREASVSWGPWKLCHEGGRGWWGMKHKVNMKSLVSQDKECILLFFFSFFSASPQSLQDFNSPTRGWPSAVKAQRPNHWTTREFPRMHSLCSEQWEQICIQESLQTAEWIKDTNWKSFEDKTLLKQYRQKRESHG